MEGKNTLDTPLFLIHLAHFYSAPVIGQALQDAKNMTAKIQGIQSAGFVL